jgi:HlyD family secretion protein
MKRKYIYILAGTVVLIAVCLFLVLGSSSKKYDYRFDKVSTGDITMYVTATGTINPVISVDVGTQVSGIINKLYADYNSVVKAGQMIAQIDSTFLVQSVKDAEASLDKARAQFNDSKRNLDREKALLDRGLESQLNYDASLTTFETNTANMKSAQASVDRAKINLAYSTIYAPIDGVVINRAVNVGQTVAASFSSPTLYTIANDLRKMQVQTTVDESDIGRISIGQEATFTVDAYADETFRGTISQIRLAPVTVQNVVNYTVVVDVNNDLLKLMPGMTANVKVLVASAGNVLRVPNMALRFQAPPDLVDSSKIQAMREGMSGNRGARPDSGQMNGQSGAPNAGGDRRAQFAHLRDSIMAAHGGHLSDEELRSAMAAEFMKRQGVRKQEYTQPTERKPAKSSGTPFGITQRFPEYEKSSYVPQHQSGRGRIWILNAKGKLEPVFVLTGVTDGKFTEITSSVLKAGDQIVLGVSSTSEVAATTQNPLTGGQQRPPGGGGGFR